MIVVSHAQDVDSAAKKPAWKILFDAVLIHLWSSFWTHSIFIASCSINGQTWSTTVYRS